MIRFITLSNSLEKKDKLESSLRKYKKTLKLNYMCYPPSITIGYNSVYRNIKNLIKEDDILCFIHHDARLHFDFVKEIPKLFKKMTNPGVVGFCGTRKQSLDGRFWVSAPENLFGGLIQGAGKKPNLVFNDKFGDIEPVEAVDGFCMFIKVRVFKDIGMFRESLEGFHFYDADLCAKARFCGYQNYVINRVAQHFSGGKLDKDWKRMQNKFVEIWQGKIPGKPIPL